MITDKQIEEAQESIFEEEFLGNGENIIYEDDEGNEDYTEERYDDEQIKEAIKLGAHWAIEQILKGLWHDASEEPKENLVLVVYDMVVDNGTIHNLVDIMTYDRFKMELYRKKWCYVSDIVGMNDFRKLVI